MYLIDTDVLSAAAPSKLVPRQDVRDWMDRNSAGLYLSVITIAEVEHGISCSRRTGAHAKAVRLTDWLETVLHLYASRILPIDVTTARMLGSVSDHARQQGLDPGLADLAIAATALVNHYTVLTRNVHYFAPLGAPVHDPFDMLPGDVGPR